MYDWLSLLDKNCVYTIFMVIDGENKGEKLVLSEEKVIWKSQKCEFLSQNLKEIKKTCQQGILIIEGQRIFCEQIGSPASLVICGAGYVSLAVIMIAKSIGMHVTVIEDRPKFADHARKAGADVVYCESFGKGLAGIEGGQDTYFVVVTRGHRYDKECLEAILQKPYAYLGMIGSRRRVTAMKEQLLQNGNDPNDVEKIHMPIGLSISAESPEEIAVVIEPQFPETDLETITTIVTRYYDQDTWKSNLIFEESSFDLLQDILESAGELEKRAPYDDLVTTKFAAIAAQ